LKPKKRKNFKGIMSNPPEESRTRGEGITGNSAKLEKPRTKSMRGGREGTGDTLAGVFGAR